MRHIKGSHIVVPRVHDEAHAYILQNADHRIVFVIPYQERYSLIGTTDIPVDAYEHPRISDDEIGLPARRSPTPTSREPLARVRRRLDATAACGRSTTTARPIRRRSRATTCSRSTRSTARPGPERAPVLSIFGGKITTYRKLAEHALRELAPFFPPMKPRVDRECGAAGRRPARARPRRVARGAVRRAIRASPAPLLRALARPPRHARTASARRRASTRPIWATNFGAELTAREIDYLRARGMGAHGRRRAVAADQVRAADDAGAARRRRRVPRSPAHEAGMPLLRLQRRRAACLRASGRPISAARWPRASGRSIYGGGSVDSCRSPRKPRSLRRGEVIGVITEQLMVREVGHPGAHGVRVVATMHERKTMMADLADAFIALARRLRHLRRAVRDGRPGTSSAFTSSRSCWSMSKVISTAFSPRSTVPSRTVSQARASRDARGRARGRRRVRWRFARWQAPQVPQWLLERRAEALMQAVGDDAGRRAARRARCARRHRRHDHDARPAHRRGLRGAGALARGRQARDSRSPAVPPAGATTSRACGRSTRSSAKTARLHALRRAARKLVKRFIGRRCTHARPTRAACRDRREDPRARCRARRSPPTSTIARATSPSIFARTWRRCRERRRPDRRDDGSRGHDRQGRARSTSMAGSAATTSLR